MNGSGPMVADDTRSTSRRLRLAGLVLVAAVALWALGAASAAYAAVHNVQPATLEGEPTDFFTDADVLAINGNVDLEGGTVCLVGGDTVDPENGSLSCQRTPWGKKDRISALTDGFSFFGRPIEGPPLVTGSWRVLTDNGPAPGEDQLSIEFTVVPCPDCDRTIAQEAIAAWKARAKALLAPVRSSCIYFDLIERGAKKLGERYSKKLPDGTTGKIINWGIERSGLTEVVGFALAAGSPIAITLAWPSHEKGLTLMKDLSCQKQEALQQIVDDPPSFDYEMVPQPVFRELYPTNEPQADLLAEAIDRMRAYLDVQRIAFERYQGASEDGLERYVHLQSRAVADYGFAAIEAARDVVDAIGPYGDMLLASPEIGNPGVTQEHLDMALEHRARVTSQGFTAAERQSLLDAGVTEAEIEEFRGAFAKDLSAAPVDVPPDATLDQWAAELEPTIDGLDAFTREAAAVAARTNAPPEASFEATPTSGDAPLSVSFTDTSTSSDLDPIERIEWDFGDGATGTGASPTHTYTSPGEYLVALTACDYLACDTATRTITVRAPNNPPVALADSLETAKNTPGSVNVLLFDSDPDGDTLAVTGWTNGQHGFVTCMVWGSCIYTPDSDYVGPDGFTYTVSDGHGGTATGSVSVSVTEEPPANRPPSAVDDVLATGQDQVKVLDVLRNDSDPDGDALSVTEWIQGENGGVVDCGAAGSCTYTPAAGFTGSDSFTYTVSDGRGGTAIGRVAVTVDAAPVNRDPVAGADAVVTGRNEPATAPLLANDSDPDGDPIAIFGWSHGEHGFVNCSGQECTYFPAFDYTGPDSFTYSIHDGRGGTATATVSVTVFDTNRPPVAADDALTVRREEAGSVFVLANDSDPDGDALTVAVDTPPEHGTLDCPSWGGCTYQPNSGFFGPDSFVYTVSDGHGGVDSATVSITVQRNRLPVAYLDELFVERNVPASVDVLANDSDPDADTLGVSDATDGANGTVSCTPGGSCTYTPNAGFVGFDQFSYTVSDGTETATGEVHVRVRDLLNAGRDWVFRRGERLSFPITVNDPPNVIHTCAWTFGDGASSDECDFDHTYTELGTYDATVRVEFSNGVTRTDTVSIRVIAERPADGGGGSGGRGEVVSSRDRTYTLDDDFDAGTLLNVNHDAPQGDELRLNSKATPFPFVYVANSGRGTAVRIDVDTGEILGEYLTAPEGMARNPSRTTVDKLGNVWVTNRDESSPLEVDGVPTPMGSVARMGLLLGGTRTDASGNPDPEGGYVKPPFEYSTCRDRDGDGLIRTSSGLGDILGWSNTDGSDNDGGVHTAADECLINYTRVLGTNTRTVAIDSNNDAWIGGANSWHEKVDGDTGERVPGTAFNLGCGGYGGLIDGNDVLWSARFGNGLLRYDTRSAAGECLGFAVGDYGLGVDPATGHVWHTQLFGNTVVKVNPDGSEAGRFAHGNDAAQGVAVDASGNVWVAHSLFGATTVGRLRTDGTYIGNVDLRGGNGPTGVAVDARGRVWSANINSNSASRIDPEIGPIGEAGIPVGYTDLTVDLGFGASPYNYSDMTGLVSLGAASPSGFWSVVQDSGDAGREWTKIAWTQQTPAGTSIDVEARAADTQAGLAGETFVPVENGAPLGLDGRFIEVRANLKTTNRDATPVLEDIRVTSNEAPVAGDATHATDRDTPVPVPLQATDGDGDALTYEIVDGPDHGALTGAAPALTYTPAAGFTGADSFTFRANDGTADSNLATVSIRVGAVNRAPVATDGTLVTAEDTAKALTLVASDADDDPLTYEVISAPQHGALSGSGASRTYSPVANYHGPDSFTFRVSDGTANSNVATVSITVTPVNDAPVANDDEAATDEDTPVGIQAADLRANDVDVDGDALTVTGVSDAQNGKAELADGVVTFTPAPDYKGPASFRYSVSDGNGGSASARVAVTVRPVNDRPSANGQTLETDEDTPLEITLEGSDPDGDQLTFAIVSQPAHGGLSGSGASRTYSPAANYHGPDSFTYTVSDGALTSAPATVAITVRPGQDAPSAADLAVETDEDTAVDITLTGSDPDGDTLTFAVAAGPAHGTLSGSGASRTYTPDPDYHGLDSFTYSVSDGNGGSDTATVSITVKPVNDAPVAGDDEAATDEDTAVAIQAADLRANDADVDGDDLTITSVSDAEHGAVEQAGGVVTFTPAMDYHGPASFRYSVSDGKGGSASARVAVTVRPVNDRPSATDLSIETDEDTAVDITLEGSDPDGDELTFEIVSQPEHGSLSGSGASRTYTPDAGYDGPDSFTYTVSDGALTSASATVTITVQPVGDAPTADDGAVTTAEDTPVDVTLEGSDPDNDPLSFEIVSAPGHGSLSGSGASRAYTPDPDYNGDDSFTFRVSDGTADSNVATVSITVAPVNDAPVARDDELATDEDTAVAIQAADLRANDSDVDGDSLTVTAVSGAEHGTVDLAGGVVTFTPAPDYHGPASFRYSVSDGNGGSASARVAVTVRPVNDRPRATGQTVETDEDTAVEITLTGSDPDGDELSFEIVGQPAHGSLSGSGANRTYTPDSGYDGPDSFSFRVSDGKTDSDLATVSIAVRAAQPGALALVIDEGSIDNGKAPNFFSAAAVNDRIARVGLRTTLPAFAGSNVGRTLVLHTGDMGSEGWLALKTIPAAWATAGPTNDGLRNFFLAGPGLGSGRRSERLLDNVPNVTPLRATGLERLAGQRACAVVYDGDVSINYGPLSGSLKGANLGVVAFEVLSVSRLTGHGSASLPKVELRVLDRESACGGPLEPFVDAPAPSSSSEPFDIVPFGIG